MLQLLSIHVGFFYLFAFRCFQLFPRIPCFNLVCWRHILLGRSFQRCGTHGIATSRALPFSTTLVLTSVHLVVILFSTIATLILFGVALSRVDIMWMFFWYMAFSCALFSSVRCVSCSNRTSIFSVFIIWLMILHLSSVECEPPHFILRVATLIVLHPVLGILFGHMFIELG